MGETERYPTLNDLMVRWDEMDNAAQQMLFALPHQMTEAAKRLDLERIKTRAVLQAFCTRESRSALAKATGGEG